MWGVNNTQSKAIRLSTQLEQKFKTQNWKEVENTSKEILALNPSDNIKTYTLKCIINSDIFLMKYDDAVSYSKDLEQLDLKDGHYFLGIVYYDMKKFDLAKEEILKAKSLYHLILEKMHINSMKVWDLQIVFEGLEKFINYY